MHRERSYWPFLFTVYILGAHVLGTAVETRVCSVSSPVELARVDVGHFYRLCERILSDTMLWASPEAHAATDACRKGDHQVHDNTSLARVSCCTTAAVTK